MRRSCGLTADLSIPCRSTTACAGCTSGQTSPLSQGPSRDFLRRSPSDLVTPAKRLQVQLQFNQKRRMKWRHETETPERTRGLMRLRLSWSLHDGVVGSNPAPTLPASPVNPQAARPPADDAGATGTPCDNARPGHWLPFWQRPRHAQPASWHRGPGGWRGRPSPSWVVERKNAPEMARAAPSPNREPNSSAGAEAQAGGHGREGPLS